MKRSLALIMASLMLVFALTACGRRDNQTTGTNGNTTNDGVTDNNAANNQTETNNATDHPVTNDLENAGENIVQGAGDVGEAVVDGVEEAGDALTGNNAKTRTGGVRRKVFSEPFTLHRGSKLEIPGDV